MNDALDPILPLLGDLALATDETIPLVLKTAHEVIGPTQEV